MVNDGTFRLAVWWKDYGWFYCIIQVIFFARYSLSNINYNIPSIRSEPFSGIPSVHRLTLKLQASVIYTVWKSTCRDLHEILNPTQNISSHFIFTEHTWWHCSCRQKLLWKSFKWQHFEWWMILITRMLVFIPRNTKETCFSSWITNLEFPLVQ